MSPDAETEVAFPGPVDLAATLGGVRTMAGDPTSRVVGEVHHRAGRAGGEPYALRFQQVAPDRVAVAAFGPGAAVALGRAGHVLGVGDRPDAFAPDHERLRALARANPGLRIGGDADPFAFLVRTVFQQRVTGVEASASYRELVFRRSERAPGPGGVWLPPAAATLRSLPDHELFAVGVDGTRARTLRELARRPRRMEALLDLSPEEAERQLASLRGIGAWTIGLFRAAVLGDADAPIVGDYHLPNTVAWVLAGEERADDARMLELLEPFRPHRYRVVKLLGQTHAHAPRYGPKRHGHFRAERRGRRRRPPPR